MKKKHSIQSSHSLGLVLFALVMLTGILFVLDSSTRPQPLFSGAAQACKSSDIAYFSNSKVLLTENPTAGNLVSVSMTSISKDGYNPACNYGEYKLLFRYDAPPRESRPFFIPLELPRSGTITTITASHRITPQELFGSSFQGSYAVKVYIVKNDDDELSSSNSIGQVSVQSSSDDDPDGDIDPDDDDPDGDIDPGGTGGGSGGSGGSGGGSTGGGGGTGSGSGSGSGSSSADAAKLCNSDRFTYDSKTGLCVPKGAKGPSNVYDLATRVIKILLIFSGIIAVIMVIIGGYFYITSAGNEEQATRGRRTITYALVGVVVVTLSYAIVSVVTKFVTSTTV